MFKKLSLTFIIIFTILEILPTVSPSKILGLYLVGSRSHRGAFDNMFLELATRGHDVTIVGYNFIEGRKVPNLTEIDGPTQANSGNFIPNPYENKLEKKRVSDIFEVLPSFQGICAIYLELPEVKALLNQKFDLLVIDPAVNECFFGFLTHFKTPYIFSSPMPILDFITPDLGIPLTPGVVPYLFSGFNRDMNLWSRISNTYFTALNYWKKLNYFESVEGFYRQKFPDAPSVRDIYYGASLVFQNVHPALDFPSLSVPGIVNTGGMHCRDGKPLPEDLAKYLDGAGPAGVVYFSMGSIVHSVDMPMWIRHHFVNAFGKLKQRVLWKHEIDTMEGVTLPPNVKIMKWVPQQDVLAHPNVKLLITQCGRQSMQETVYHGVPALGIPIFYDQDENIDRLVELGLGLKLNLEDITAERLLAAINEILSNPSYAERANLKSLEFRDQPIKSVDLAVYWTEHVIRHGKTLDLFPLSRKYSVIRYYALDAFCIILGSVILGVYILYKVLKRIFSSPLYQVPKLAKLD